MQKWTCIFPGKMGLSWKRGKNIVGSKEEAEAEANKYANVVAVPLKLWTHLKEMEHRMVAAEGKLVELGVRADYVDGSPVFVKLDLPKFLKGEGTDGW